MPVSLALVWLAFIATLFTGWVINLVSLVQSLGGDVTTLFIARCVGVVFAPLGAVLGFFA